MVSCEHLNALKTMTYIRKPEQTPQRKIERLVAAMINYLLDFLTKPTSLNKNRGNIYRMAQISRIIISGIYSLCCLAISQWQELN